MHSCIVFHFIFAVTYRLVITTPLIDVSFQFTEATRNGLAGLAVARHVGEERCTEFVSA